MNTFQVFIAFLDDGQAKDSDIGSNDAPSDGFPLLLSSSSGSVSLLPFPHEDSDSSLDEDTLSHGEALLVVSTGNFEDVPLELISQLISVDFLSHSFVVEYGTLFVVIDFVSLLATCEWIGNVELQT